VVEVQALEVIPGAPVGLLPAGADRFSNRKKSENTAEKHCR
jgi:hypothetical protein